jgi:cysteine desulfurase/selenocysteine lyase
MTTNKAKGAADVRDVASPSGIELPPVSLPDPQTIARMASEFLAALPRGSESGERLASKEFASSEAAAGAPAVSEEGLRGLPVELANSSTSTSIPAMPGWALTFPSEGNAVSPFPVATPSFSFLESARPLFSEGSLGDRAAVPDLSIMPAMPLQSVPFSSDIGDLSSISHPAITGAPRHASITEGTRTFEFLGASRSLGPISVDPVLEPLGPELRAFPDLGLSSQPFEVETVRRDFPILQERVNGRRLVWLDNAATTQKPQSVIDRLKYFYEHENSNVHRAAHELAARSTDAYEAAREKTRRFLNAPSVREIVFVRGATEGINLVAKSWGWQNVHKDDEVVITWLEHHANIVPWQMLCAAKGAHLRVAPVDNRGDVLLDEYTKLLGPRTRLVALPQVSNALGTVTPAREMIEVAHRYGAKVLLDGAQAVSHMPVDVQLLDCDFYVFSGHKVFAPTGIGVVYGKPDVLEQTPPWQGGGNMIADVTFEKTVYQPPPGRFEAGTGNIADAVGLGAAIDYVQRIGMPAIARYEHDLLVYGLESLRGIPGLHFVGSPKEQAGVISFVLDGFRTEDVGAALNREGIAVRAGHHCAQPILRRFGKERTVRASLAFYNSCEEIDALVAALWNLKGGRTAGPI